MCLGCVMCTYMFLYGRLIEVGRERGRGKGGKERGRERGGGGGER